MRFPAIFLLLTAVSPLATYAQNGAIADSVYKEASKQLGEVRVTGSKTAGTDKQLISEIKNDKQIVSGISAEQIGRSQDRTAAEAVKRVSGVTVNNDRFVVIRGLNERYNTVWLNNVIAPSQEPDKKAFSFDMLPSNVIENILLYKTPAADLPGDFSGGMVRIFTKTAPLGTSFSCELNTFYRPGSTFEKLQFTDGSAHDWLASGSKFREIPQGVPDRIHQSSVALTKLFRDTWSLHDRTAMPDVNFNTNYSIGFKLRNIQLGSLTNVNYTTMSNLRNIHRLEYESPVATIVPDEATKDYHERQCTSAVRLGALQNFSVNLDSRHKFEFKNLFSQTGTDNTIVRQGDDESNFVKSYTFAYEQRTLLSSQLEYKYKSLNSANRYNAIGGYSFNQRLTPDLRNVSYQYPPDTFLRANIAPGAGVIDITEGATRYWSTLRENIYSFNQDYTHRFTATDLTIDARVGSYVEYRSRVLSSRTLGYTLPTSTIRPYLTGLDPWTMFSSAGIDAVDSNRNNKAVGFRINENTSSADSYTGQNLLIAGYASLEFNIRKRLMILAGVRMEDNIQRLQTVVSADSVKYQVHNNFYLPSINARYQLNNTSAFRAAYGATLDRPGFREWSPAEYYDFELFALSHGTLFPSMEYPHGFILKTAVVQNFDMRYECYPTEYEMISVDVFYKHFKDPIEQTVENHEHRTGVSRETTFRNATSAYCAGIEVEVRKSLVSLNDLFNTNYWQHLTLAANALFTRSEVTNLADTASRPHSLQGQAPYVVNASVNYINKEKRNSMQVSVIYNVVGPRVFLVGANDGSNTQSGPSIGEMPRNTIDLTLKKNLGAKTSVNFGIQDILNQPVTYRLDGNMDQRFTAADKIITQYKRGSYYTIGIKLQL